MNKLFTLLIIFSFGVFSLNAQEFVQVSVGASYANQAFYSLNDNEVTTLDNQSWDLAFATGFAQVGILYNESASLSSTSSLRVYLAPTNEFTDVFDSTELIDSIYNTEESWEDGALNSVKSEENPFDFGWGSYNPTTHVVSGIRVYALKLRDESWKKLEIQSLSNGIYTIRYADLDGENEVTTTINTADFDSALALFSFDTETTIAAPISWDLLFGRYLSALDAGGGDIIQYPLTGVLTAPGVEVAEARNIDPTNVDHLPYLDSMETRIDIIGSDWKNFSLQTFSWELDLERAYFIKLPDNHLWKIAFVDFEGSSTGTSTFEKTDLGEVTSILEPESNFIDYGVFPNPVVNEFNISFSLKNRRSELDVSLVNSLGQKVWSQTVSGDAGFNVLNFQAPNIPTGLYHLMVGQGDDMWTSTTFFE